MSNEQDLYESFINEQTAFRYWRDKLKDKPVPHLDPLDLVILTQSFLRLPFQEESAPHTPRTDFVSSTQTEHQIAQLRATWRIVLSYLTTIENRTTNEEIAEDLKRLQTFCELTKEFLLDQRNHTLFKELLRQSQDFLIRSLLMTFIDHLAIQRILTNPDFGTVTEIAQKTGYSMPHLRALVRKGLVVGMETEAGWYVSLTSVQTYASQEKAHTAGSPQRFSR